jgi:peptide/nickel transport system substrate-binding protein
MSQNISKLSYLPPDRTETVLLGATDQIFQFKNSFMFKPRFFDVLGSKKKRRLIMKAKWMILLVGVGVLTMVLLTGYQPAVAAPPTGEVKTVAPMWGNHIFIPYLEITQANDWMHLLYDFLVASTPEGRLAPHLSLANKWEMSPDGLTWTFYLRKGVKFHDGVELTAKDVKFSLELCRLPTSASTNANFIRRDIGSIEVKDPYTLVIHCKKPAIFLPNVFSPESGLDGMIVPKDYYEKVGENEFTKRPIGSGPYKFNSQMAGSFIKIEATEKHWRDGVPMYKYMTFLAIPEESTRLAMLKTGEADIARISATSVQEALGAGLKIFSKENTACVQLLLGTQWTSPVFSDIRFRKALNLAIDKESTIKHIFAGMAKPMAMYPGSNMSLAGGDQGLKVYPYDPKEAARLIKEGGWEGHEFTMISYPRAGCPEFPLVVEAVAGYWEKIGLKPRIRMSEYAVWRKTWNEGKTHNQVYGFDDVVSPEINTLVEKFMDKWYGKYPRSSANIPELNEKFDRIEKSLDVAEVSSLLSDIYRFAYDNYLAIPICEISDRIATIKRIPKWDTGRRRNDRNYYDLIKQR